MPDSFFVSSKTRKRKRTSQGGPSTSKKAPRTANDHGKPRPRGPAGGGHAKAKGSRKDEELESDATQDDDEPGGGIDDLDLRVSDADPGASEDEDENETPAEKRLRLAKIYLDSVKEGLADGEFDAAEIDRELISARLKKDVLEHAGKIHKFVADTIDLAQPPPALRTRGHRFSVTCAVGSADGKFLFTAGKEGSIIKWDLQTSKQLSIFRKIRLEKSTTAGKSKGKGKEKAVLGSAEVKGHTDEVWALALSEDNRYLASGGKDRKVVVWDVEKGEWLKSFGGHKDSISALTFRKGSLQLYSASFDRTIRLFDLSVMGYVETLFGHQDQVLHMDALRAETAVSVGGRDKTVRFWKIVEESQLVFRGGGRSAIREVLDGGLEGLEDESEHVKDDKEANKEKKFIEGSIDCVAMVDETTFVSGGDSGSLCVWTTQKKKPQFTQALAHGLHEVHSETEGIVATARWITALACLRYSDLIASGSWESDIRLWKLDSKQRALVLIGSIPAPGFVNSLQFISPPRGAVGGYSWAAQQTASDAPDSEAVPQTNGLLEPRPATKGQAESLLLVAGMGQEPRLGRWMKLHGGAVNGSRVFALHPRTSP